MKYTDQQRLQKIADSIATLRNAVDELHITEDKLLTDTPTQWLVTTPLYKIGEHAWQMSPEYKARTATYHGNS